MLAGLQPSLVLCWVLAALVLQLTDGMPMGKHQKKLQLEMNFDAAEEEPVKEAFDDEVKVTLPLEIRFEKNKGPSMKAGGKEIPAEPRIENIEVVLKQPTGRQLPSGLAELEEINLYPMLSDDEKDRMHALCEVYMSDTEAVTDPEP